MKGKWCATGNVFCQEISCPECNIFWEREARYKTERFRLRLRHLGISSGIIHQNTSKSLNL